jgi:hypothetical protein
MINIKMPVAVFATLYTYEAKCLELRTGKPSTYPLKQIHVSVVKNNLRDI